VAEPRNGRAGVDLGSYGAPSGVREFGVAFYNFQICQGVFCKLGIYRAIS
jgi:hypothetical protein